MGKQSSLPGTHFTTSALGPRSTPTPSQLCPQTYRALPCPQTPSIFFYFLISSLPFGSQKLSRETTTILASCECMIRIHTGYDRIGERQGWREEGGRQKWSGSFQNREWDPCDGKPRCRSQDVPAERANSGHPHYKGWSAEIDSVPRHPRLAVGPLPWASQALHCPHVGGR